MHNTMVLRSPFPVPRFPLEVGGHKEPGQRTDVARSPVVAVLFHGLELGTGNGKRFYPEAISSRATAACRTSSAVVRIPTLKRTKPSG
jgi:hypothetical protein